MEGLMSAISVYCVEHASVKLDRSDLKFDIGALYSIRVGSGLKFISVHKGLRSVMSMREFST